MTGEVVPVSVVDLVLVAVAQGSGAFAVLEEDVGPDAGPGPGEQEK